MAEETYYTVKQSSLTAVADAIREKGGTSESLSFPNGFVSAVNTMSTGSGEQTTWIGTCETYAADQYKVVVCPDYVRKAGNIIGIRFTYGNTSSTPSLRINNTTRGLIIVGSSYVGTNNPLKWGAGTILYFMDYGENDDTYPSKYALMSEQPQSHRYNQWVSVSFSTDGNNFFGNVIKNDHLCVIINEGGGTTFSNSGTLLTGLPESFLPVYFTVFGEGGVSLYSVTIEDGALVMVDMDYLDPTIEIMGFTLVYPIHST